MTATEISFGVVALLVVLALAFDFMNGFHDAANSIATVVSTGVLKPQQAVVLAAFFNFVAIFVFHLSVAATVGKGIVEPGVVDHYVVFGALIGAIAWNLITWWYGIPSSSSHALIGGLVGAVVAKAGTGALIARRHLQDGGLHLRLAAARLPARRAADGAASLTSSGARRRCGSTTWFRRLQLVSAGLYSLGHGGNDAQKTIGIIWMLLIAAGYASAERRDAADLGDLVLLRRDRPRHAVRRLAHRQDDGPADHQAEAGRRLLRRDRRRDHAVPRHRRSASRCRRRTRSPARSSASARCAAPRRCAGASPATSSGPGSSRSRLGVRRRACSTALSFGCCFQLTRSAACGCDSK